MIEWFAVITTFFFGGGREEQVAIKKWIFMIWKREGERERDLESKWIKCR